MSDRANEQKPDPTPGETCSPALIETAKKAGFYQAVVDSAATAIICITKDLNGVIQTWNKNAESVYGYTAEEAIGKHIAFIVPPEHRWEVDYILGTVRQGRTVQGIETERVRKDGTRIAVTVIASPVRDLSDSVIGAAIIAVDVTEQKRRERQLQAAKELSDALNRINALIFSTRDFGEIMQRVIEEAARAVGADSGAVYMPEGDHWAARYVYGLPESVRGKPFSVEDIKYSILAVRERRVVMSNSILSDKELCKVYVTEYGVQALIDAPLLMEETIGDFAVYSCARNVFTELHADFISKVSASVALAVKNARLFSEVRSAEERVRRSKSLSDALNEINALINSTLDADEIMKKVVVQASYAIGCESATLATVDDDGWTIRFDHNFPEAAVGNRFSTNDVPFAALALHGKEPVVVSDAYHDPRARPERQKKYGVPSVMVVPLIVKGKGFGAIFFNYHSRPADFSPEQIDFAAKLSLSVSLALENARLYQALRESEERFRESFAHAPIGMVLTDMAGRFLYANRAYQEIVGYSEKQLQQPGFDFKRLTHPGDLPSNMEYMDRMAAGEIPSFSLEKRYMRKDGEVVWVRVSATTRRDAQGRPLHYVALIENINERKRLEQQITHMAQHDPLTGLPNRRLFREVAAVELAQARRHRTKLAIFFLDLDRFKEVNDTFGHDAGDQLLQQAAARLRSAVRSSDTVARIGGDEFNVIVADIEQAEYAGEAARKIIAEMRRPFVVNGHELNVSASIGISVFPDDSNEIDTLLRYADIAMYYAKEHGRNRFQFYNPVINTRSLERVGFEDSLRGAIGRHELKLFFQPLVDVATGRMVCAEALIRWQHPEKGLLLPEQFFGAAEDIGLMPEIDDWVLADTSRQLAEWIGRGIPNVCVTVNLSAREFQNPALPGKVSRLLSESSLPPDCMDLEITETTAMADVEQTIKRLNELRSMGIRVSIDDFGTGYSSLGQLKRLPVQKLKIDKSFVRDIDTDADDRAIVNAVLLMAHSMKLRVVAEGVEGQGQLASLRELKCDEAQGFLFSEAVTAERMEELLKA